jgi:hypothetical protein
MKNVLEEQKNVSQFPSEITQHMKLQTYAHSLANNDSEKLCMEILRQAHRELRSFKVGLK